MKNLILLRHAHAQNPFNYSDDFVRPLSKRGKDQCRATGSAICDLIIDDIIPAPDLILSSPAIRARETVECIHDSMKTSLSGTWTPEIVSDKSLYLPSVEELLVSIWGSSNEYQAILVCSHNPGISRLAEALFGRISAPLGTAGCIAGKFDAKEWSEINKVNSIIAGTYS